MSLPRHRDADVVLRDGSTVHVRPVGAEDAAAVQAFFEHLSPESITLRFFSRFPDLDRAARWATQVVDQHRYGLVAIGSADGRVVAHVGWEGEPGHPGRAESPSPSLTPCRRTIGCFTCFVTAASRSRSARSRVWSWWNWRHRRRRSALERFESRYRVPSHSE